MSRTSIPLLLDVLPEQIAICRLSPDELLPDWSRQGGFWSVTREGDELSVICPTALVPAGQRSETGWRAMRVRGLLDFDLVGILAELTGRLAEARITVFALSTFDTDLILVREAQLQAAADALRAGGHTVELEA